VFLIEAGGLMVFAGGVTQASSFRSAEQSRQSRREAAWLAFL
jgi:hypothetical protein